MAATSDARLAPPPSLEYAVRPPLLRRRFARRLGLLLLLIATAAVSIRWGPAIARRAEMLYWQHQCRNYTAPPDQVVYEHGPGGPPALLARGGDYVPVTLAPRFGVNSPLVAAARVPRCATKFLAATTPMIPAASWGLLPSSPAAVLFMHERRTPSGASYLVIVTSQFLSSADPLFVHGHDVYCSIIRPAGWRQPPAECTAPWEIDVLYSSHPTPLHLRVFAGQADAVDPTRFVIPYEVDGERRQADGHLVDVGSGCAAVEFSVPPPWRIRNSASPTAPR